MAGGYITKKRFDREIAAAEKKILDDQRPRCGTCGSVCDPFHSDEGYSLCCNDRIEYPEEWSGSASVTLWAIETVRWEMTRQGKTINRKWLEEADARAMADYEAQYN